MEVAVIQIRSFKTVICKPMGDIIIVITWYITMCHSVFFLYYHCGELKYF